ncbi:hypothetical protein LP090_11550 [Moraxella bovis]|uniref:hypothetical protein n=1 Tax=Moraxella bovis TaxID=476 RepID=UPI002227D76A|nr:hypothetical protein [Moraxella bovis]UYZ68805.1 hypothetical protein LP122_01445 [Moraxella bovis]UYZ71182.1 hypothetical protein LP089_01490 [Moraxella bovis]UYZ72904.1 hypothetical protein LP105_11160 [Moraxella bovis]UZA14477.1 hypothetical protein LP102_01445 [Moraxella bovis]UZA27163.1 hypothetical protein LP119_11410 [Moraxella bovis]
MKYFIATLFVFIHTTAFSAPPYQSAEHYHAGTCDFYSTLIFPRTPPYIGIPLDRNVNLMPYQEFMERLEPVLGQYIDPRSRWAESEGLQQFLALKDFGSELYLFKKNKNIYKISYITSNTIDIENQNLSNSDKMMILDTINIFVQDHQKSQEILDELYKRYLGQLELVVDGYISVFLEHDGKYFSMKGYNINYHPIERCNYKIIHSISIE